MVQFSGAIVHHYAVLIVVILLHDNFVATEIKETNTEYIESRIDAIWVDVGAMLGQL